MSFGASMALIVAFVVHAHGAVPDFIPAKDYEPYERAIDRKISISPVQPKSGISSGLVIYMGHPIPPPYVIEWENGRISINGVRVLPTRQWETSNAAIQAALNSRTEEQKRKGQERWETEQKIRQMAREGAWNWQIMRFARRQKCFTNVVWEGPHTLSISSEDGTFSMELPAKGQVDPVFTEADKIEMKKRQRDHDVGSIVRVLQEDRMVLITAMSGPMGQTRTREFPSDVAKIMDDTSLDTKEKYKRIKAISWTIQPNLAWEIVENYDPKEWHNLKLPARGAH